MDATASVSSSYQLDGRVAVTDAEGAPAGSLSTVAQMAAAST